MKVQVMFSKPLPRLCIVLSFALIPSPRLPEVHIVGASGALLVGAHRLVPETKEETIVDSTVAVAM